MATVDQVMAFQLQLDGSAEQTRMLFLARDTLRQESSNAIAELRRLLAEEQQRNSRGGGNGGKFEKEFCFVNTKTFEGGKFSGAKTKNYKAWAKRAKVFCSAQCRGFRRAMETAEAQSTKPNIQGLKKAGDWNFAVEVNKKLSGFLATYTADEALCSSRSIQAKGSRQAGNSRSDTALQGGVQTWNAASA